MFRSYRLCGSPRMTAHPIQVQDERAAELVCGGCISTFLLWVGRKVMPSGTKIGKYRYWLVSDLFAAAEKLHHPTSIEPKETRYGKAQRDARRLSRAA